MSESHKQVFANINQDKDVRNLKPGEYRLLRNGIPVQGTTASALEGAITSVYGHALLTNAALEANSVVVGFLEDRANNRAFFAVSNDGNTNHTIYKVSSSFVVSTVLRTSLWDFDDSDFVDMDIIGDILILTNGRSEIKKINVTQAAAGSYGTISTEKITLIKRPPQLPLVVDRNNDTGFLNNYITELSIILTYRYIYEDDEESVFAPPALLNFESGTANRIAFEIPTAETMPTTVKQVDFAMMINGGNELVVFKSSTVSGGTLPALAYTYGVGGTTEPDSKAVKWSDSIPVTSKSIKIFKNRVITFNNTEGYDYSQQPLTGFLIEAVDGIVQNPFKHRGLYLVGMVFFDFAGRIISTRMSATGLCTIPDRTNNDLTSTDYYNIVFDITAADPLEIPIEATHYSIVRTKCLNIAFFLTGKTNDVFFFKKDADGNITYNKTYSVNNNGVAIDISHLTEYNIGYTFQPGDRIILYLDGSGTKKDFEIKSQDGRFLYVDNYNVSMIGAATLYQFEVYTPKSPSNVELLYESMVYDSRNGAGLSGIAGNMAARYTVSNPGTVSRDFSTQSGRLIGDTTAQETTAQYGGRVTDYSYTGYSSTDPYSNTRTSLGTFSPIVVMNPYAKYYNVWIHNVGVRTIPTPLVDAQEVLKISSIRFSQPYTGGSQINGLSTFEALDEYTLPVENGAGTILAEAGDVLMALHEVESSAIYVGEGFVNTTSGSSFLSKTESVIGDDRRYLGGHGTTNQASVVSRDSRVYFYDSRKGCIVRRSQDGLTRISDYGIKGLVSYLASLHNADSGNSRIVAGWDPQYECYCISFYLTGGSYNFTLYFHERTNSWVCVTDLMPIRFGILGQYQLAFNTGGGVWKQTPEANYNTFFGTAYNRTITWEIAPFQSLMKVLEAIELDAEVLYTTADTNEEIVAVYLEKDGTKQTSINYTDFVQREGVWRSPFFNTINDVNFGTALESKFKSPYKVRGQNFYFTLVYNGTAKNRMRSITVFFRPKMLSNP